MKRLAHLLICATLTFLPACASTFNQNLAVGYTTVSATRDTATTLLTAKKINADDAENVLQQTDNARTALDLARTMHRSGQTIPAQNKLEATATALRALQIYLGGKQ